MGGGGGGGAAGSSSSESSKGLACCREVATAAMVVFVCFFVKDFGGGTPYRRYTVLSKLLLVPTIHLYFGKRQKAKRKKSVDG